MNQTTPGINVDILVTNDNQVLLGLLDNKWCENGRQLYGVPGRDIHFKETMGDTIRRNIHEEFGCGVTEYKIISVNANYAQGNHYIGIGATARIDGEPKLLMPDDWEKWEWFDLDSIPPNLHPATKNLIECFTQGLVNVAQ